MAPSSLITASDLAANGLSLLLVVLGSVSFGSLLTIAVTWLKEWHTEKGKRRADLQRDIFFEAATSVRDSSRSLQRLSNPQIPLASPEESMAGPSGGWLEKLYLIGSPETLEALTQRDKSAGLAHFKLSPLRFAVNELDQRISKQQARLEQIAQGRSEITNLAIDAQRRNVTDPAFYQYAQQTFQELLAEEQSVNDAIATLWQRRNDVHHRLITEGFDAFVKQRTVERRALLQMRNEMKVGPTLDAEVLKSMDDADEEVRKMVADFFSSFATQIDALVDGNSPSSDVSLLPPSKTNQAVENSE